MAPDFERIRPTIRKNPNDHVMSWGADLAVLIGPRHEVRQFSTTHILSRPQVTRIVGTWLDLLDES
ncbi:hypothetical protein OCH239_10445 [Roseivivax halodurans JCM 10272]|uniref:Uncharacterized protein n=2 Tax=Roseivivax halodurans TaxID=93683 RepID=X7EBV8_9RHOB|nr:hypothetical protein OCH239_10445 [Roseivivax halodurans JCM 10272]